MTHIHLRYNNNYSIAEFLLKEELNASEIERILDEMEARGYKKGVEQGYNEGFSDGKLK